MIKKIALIIVGISLIVIAGVVIYFREFQNLPMFALSALPQLQTPSKDQKILIIVPHSDDEILATGGYIAQAIKNQAKVTVVLATNGDGHRFSSVEQFRALYPNANDYIQSGYARQQETINGLAALGITKENIIFLGFPDGGLKNLLNDNYQTPYTSPYTHQNKSPYSNSYQLDVAYTGANLTNNLVSIIGQIQPDAIFVSSDSDMHPDHRALPQFLTKALAQTIVKPQIYYYLVHARGYPYPKGLHPDRTLNPPLRFMNASDSWENFPLNTSIENQKEQAIKQYQSQLKVPILHSLMDSFIRQNEIFVKANN